MSRVLVTWNTRPISQRSKEITAPRDERRLVGRVGIVPEKRGRRPKPEPEDHADQRVERDRPPCGLTAPARCRPQTPFTDRYPYSTKSAACFRGVLWAERGATEDA